VSRLVAQLLLCTASLAAVPLALAERAEAPPPPEDTPASFEFGGAARFNYGWLDYAPTSRLQLELLRVDLKGEAGPAFFSVQYRWYDGFSAIHHAWAGWKFDAASDLRVGVAQVPFGLLPTASHSFWFGSGYYLGLEDDYDLGAVWQRHVGAHQWHVGLFAGDEYRSGRRYDRYSFDVATTDALPYREHGRLNLRYAHTGQWRGGELQLGASVFFGQVQRRDTGRDDGHQGAALHAQWSRDGLSWQAQWARYRYRIPGDRIALSAFQAPFEIAREADVPTLNLSYALPRTGWLETITCYNDLSATLPVGGAPGLRDSVQNVTGCSFGKGPMLVYIDWIAGKNMWFAGGDGIGLAAPDNPGWHSRLNLNIGFYF